MEPTSLKGRKLREARRDVTMVFQSYALFPHMTVAQNIAYGLESGGMKPAEARNAGNAGLELVGIAGLGDRLPSELSGGQQQRVAVARALVLEPQVLLLDEPLSNLDARLRRRVRTETRELQQRPGFTAVYVTHDQDEALAVSDRIMVMKDGEIAQSGSPRELYEAPASEFIGEANVIDCEVQNLDEGRARFRVGDAELTLPARECRPGPARLAVRPNAFSVNRDSAGIEGRIVSAAYRGDHIEYEIDGSTGRLFVIDGSNTNAISPGARGHGARLNGQPIQITRRFDLSSGLLGLGGNDRVPPARLGQLHGDLAAEGIAWVRYGSGALMLAYVAAGRLVGYCEPRMSLWDCLAAHALIEAAGGKVLPIPPAALEGVPFSVMGTTVTDYEKLAALTRFEARDWENRDCF